MADDVVAELIKRTEKIANKAVERRKEVQSRTPQQMEFPVLSELLPAEIGSTTKYPTLLTRIPFFSPVKSRKSLDTNWEDGDIIQTSWGRIQRFGPGLDIYDEDTLLGLFRLARRTRVVGVSGSMPIPIDQQTTKESEVEVHWGTVTAYEINKYLKRDVGGKDLKACRESFNRLAFTSMKIFNDVVPNPKEGKITFFTYVGDQDFKGPVTVQFDPDMIRLLESYTFINMEVRRELSDIGKAVHKFLSGQLTKKSPFYEISLVKLMETIRFRGAVGEFKRSLAGTKATTGQLDTMVRLKWLKNWEISGSGRKTPFMLTVEKKC